MLFAVIVCGYAQTLEVANKLHLYDRLGNLLLYVQFEYDGSGKHTGRTVYDWGGYVLRRTTFLEENGTIIRENYLDGSEHLRNYITFAYDGTTKTSTGFDEFDNILFEVSYDTAAADNSYAFNIGARVDFEYGTDNKINMINVFDNDQDLARIRPVEKNHSFVSSITMLAPNSVRIVFVLTRPQTVRARLYDLKGNLVGALLNKRFQNGKHAITLDVSDNKVKADGIYILKFSLEDKGNSYKMKVIK
jgi:hypothetical protein